MYPKFDYLSWLKSRTFWQVAFCLIFLTVLQIISKGNSVNSNYFNNSLREREPAPARVDLNK